MCACVLVDTVDFQNEHMSMYICDISFISYIYKYVYIYIYIYVGIYIYIYIRIWGGYVYIYICIYRERGGEIEGERDSVCLREMHVYLRKLPLAKVTDLTHFEMFI